MTRKTAITILATASAALFGVRCKHCNAAFWQDGV